MKRLIILGGGFAGVWSALSARRLAESKGKELEIYLISNSDSLGIRPRYYEDDAKSFKVEFAKIFDGLNIHVIQGTIADIDIQKRIVRTDSEDYNFDALVYALGSRIVKPSFSPDSPLYFIDSLKEAGEFDLFLKSKSSRNKMKIGIAGAGFTGLEAAMEIPKRLRGLGILDYEVHLIERGPNVAPEFGENARGLIQIALKSEKVNVHTGVSIQSFQENEATLTNGDKINLDALVWTAGVRPPELSRKLSKSLDQAGRILVNNFLQVPDCDFIWSAGDVAAPSTDGKNRSAMSCQHAIPQGKIAGHNAAAFLLGLPPISYQQHLYVTCLDLGDWGALITMGWDRNKVVAIKDDAKKVKRMINLKVIYPPNGSRKVRLNAGAHDNIGSLKAKVLEFALSNRVLRHLITMVAY